MSELSYLISLTESLSSFVNSEGSDSKSKFAKIYFDLLISDGTFYRSEILGKREKQIYTTSVKLLFEKYNDEALEAFAYRFIRDEDPALIPAFELVLLAINPNNLDSQHIDRLVKSFEKSGFEKKTLILSFLYGGRFLSGLKNYELLIRFGSLVFIEFENNSKVELLRILNNHKALHYIERNQGMQEMLRQMKEVIINTINTLNLRGKFSKLERVLNQL